MEEIILPSTEGDIFHRYLPLIAYIVLSVIWFIIFAISGFIFGTTTFSIVFSIIWVVIYIPVLIYYLRRGETGRAWIIVIFTFLTTILYMFYVLAWLLSELLIRVS